jgi:hypothetical protein
VDELHPTSGKQHYRKKKEEEESSVAARDENDGRATRCVYV